MRGGPVADRRLDPAALHPTATFVDGWLQARPRDWLAQVGTVALDPRSLLKLANPDRLVVGAVVRYEVEAGAAGSRVVRAIGTVSCPGQASAQVWS
jgi:hypothetical protein